MFFTTSHSSDENEETKKQEGASPIREDGSYEIVFDSTKESDTAYSVGGYNAYGFTANGSNAAPQAPDPKKKKKPRKSKANLLFILAISLFIVSLILTGVNIALMVGGGQTSLPGGENGTGAKNPDPWVNPAPLEGNDVYAAATEKVINSVVVINCASSAGSGVVWASNSEESYILTCNHVIEGASEIQVILYSGKGHYAEVVGTDARTDIAILKVSTPNLPAITLPNEDTELKLGQSVIAIGNPLGSLGNSVSNGILSSLSRTVSIEGTTMDLIQTNAAVNSGNSGGGLFDLNGQLIGLVNAKVTQNTVEGIGFAIPFQTLRAICSELLEKGFIAGRPMLGITTVTVSNSNYRDALQAYPDLEEYAIKNDFFGSYPVSGVYVVDSTGVVGYGENSDTLKFGDRIIGIGTNSVSSTSDIAATLNDYNAGDTVEITVVRKNKTVVIELILGEVGK